jgi:hypothetical protein
MCFLQYLISIILASPSRLNLHVVCAKDTPVAGMLAHFLHLPLVVVYKFEKENDHRMNGHTPRPPTPPSHAQYSPQRNGICLAEDDHYLGRRISIAA